MKMRYVPAFVCDGGDDEPYVRAGEVVTCSAGHRVAVVNRDIGKEIVDPEWFDWEIPQPARPGTPCACGARYIAVLAGTAGGYLHVERRGWLSSDPKVKAFLDENA